MADSETQLAQLALSHIGETTIMDIDDTSNDASRLCKLHLEPVIREVGRSHSWNCLMKQQQLAANTTAPNFHYTYSYTLPINCLKLTKLNGYSVDSGYIQDNFDIVGRDIYTDADECKIEFVDYPDDVTELDPLFDRCVVTLLASYLAPIIAGDNQLAIALRNEYEGVVLPNAKRIDGNERRARRYSNINNSSWLKSRYIQPGEGWIYS